MPKQGTVTACDHLNLWAHFSIQPRWILGWLGLQVNISCIYTVVQVTLLFLWDITLALQPKGVEKNSCESHPSPWTHSWRGPLTSSTSASTCCCRISENMKAKSSPVLKGNSDIKTNPMKSHLMLPHRGLQNPVIKQWKKQLLPSHLHEQIRFSELHKTQCTRKPPGPTSATF